MNTIKRKLKWSLLVSALMAWMMCMPVLASADDNSLAALNVENGTVSPEFVYSTWEYNVTVEPGTTELYLDPVTSNPNATITSITGTVLNNGEATVMVNTASESGIPMTYTLYVREGLGEGEAADGEAEEASEVQTEAPTEAPTEPQTEPQTEPVTTAQTESQTEAVATNALQDQVSKLKNDSDLMMKILYGLIALSVVLLFLIINLILRNRDLKDDLKDAEDQLAYQTNEFARKEKIMVTDNYYAPTQQGEVPKPADTRRSRKRDQAPVQELRPDSKPSGSPEPPAAPTTEPVLNEQPEEEKKDVNITMVDL